MVFSRVRCARFRFEPCEFRFLEKECVCTRTNTKIIIFTDLFDHVIHDKCFVPRVLGPAKKKKQTCRTETSNNNSLNNVRSFRSYSRRQRADRSGSMRYVFDGMCVGRRRRDVSVLVIRLLQSQYTVRARTSYIIQCSSTTRLRVDGER